MEHLKMHSPNMVDQNIEKLAELFPGCVTEAKGEDGKLRKAIDFDLLKQELSRNIVEGPQERYQLNWPGKREALLTANAPIAKTLRPCREESVDFDTTQNLFIEGDNLDALKLLQETYLNKVKLIYIDPPYNTGKDFVYEDDFAEDIDSYVLRSNQIDEEGNRLLANSEANGRFHSDWLSMMYPRLTLARNLLTDDGVIFISIDDNEQATLKRLCDEVFGAQNFVTSVIWEKRYSPQNAVKWFSESHDFILVYAKNKLNWEPKLLERSQAMNARYRNLDNDPRGVWKPENATAQAGHGTDSQFYIFTAPNGKQHALPNGRCWVYTEEVFNKMVEDNRVWFGADGNNVPAIKRFLSEVKQGTACQTIWKYGDVGHNQEGKKEVNKLFPEAAVFDTPKPVRLIDRILHLSTEKDSIVLDFFSGSATTAHAVMQKNAEDGGSRKFIMVQLPEQCEPKSTGAKAGYKTIADVSKERIRRAGSKVLGQKDGSTTLDVGFRTLKIDSSNLADVYYQPDTMTQEDLFAQIDNVKEDRTEEDLLFQVMLDWGVDLTLPIRRETIDGKTVFFVADNALVACFDKESGINEAFVKELAKFEPLRLVFRDAGFASDSTKINVEQVLKQLSPNTDVKSI
ncbi:site-specific DNA-methyltransferase [Vibrio vulnificus]|nr:site-specific DNA-methyltransferase [Vibrio vulnificus]EHH1188683.1 site-specific DNA-methyltransferase [Vibrio vulnificus]EHU4846356.1 site-specific DNA-methyltransferase [Vibrio vulnificus]EHZ2900119.1 site-specific DNA-methyltransferase [Vibrio vulnificus]EIA1302950.1 site-specific DNA-methyltransferase [Vibrio vulnificus]